MKEKHLFRVTFAWLAMICALLTVSCTDLTDVENDIKKVEEDITALQEKITTLEEAVTSLRTAYESGKVIEKVEPVSEEDMKGWKITFVDGDVITVMSEVIEIEEPEPTEPEGVIIKSIVQDPMTGIVTIELIDGTKFEFDLSVTFPTSIVLLNEELKLDAEQTGSFEFRVNPSNATINYDVTGENPQVMLDLISSVTRADAASYVTAPSNYKLTKIEPSLNEAGEVKVGQYTATVQELGATKVGYDDKVALVVASKDAHGNAIEITSSTLMTVNMVGGGTDITEFSINGVAGTIIGEYISVKLTRETSTAALVASFATNGEKVFVGDVEQVSGSTANNFSFPVEYRVVAPNGDEKTYYAMICYTNLPVCYVNTANGAPILDKENWIAGSRMIIGNAAEADLNGVYENMNIRGRGNSTWSLPKKPYAIKLDKKAKVLGMPKHKRWCLLANYLDHTMIRNAVSFEISRYMTALDWTPRGDCVDLVLNGTYQGSYYLCEQVKIDENRVNVAELEIGDTSEPNVTGGYLIELDTNYDEPNKFRSNYGTASDGYTMPVNIKEPDEEVILSGSAQFNYIKNYYNTIEGVLYKSNFPSGSTYQELIDIDSYIDWWLVFEITGNEEPNHPKSCYMNKDRGGKMKAGPVWDFDWGTFVPGDTGFLISNSLWYGRLFKDPVFVARVKERWAAVKPMLDSNIPVYIDEQAANVKESAVMNHEMWPITIWRPNGDEDISFDAAIDRMKEAFKARMNNLNNAINNL